MLGLGIGLATTSVLQFVPSDISGIKLHLSSKYGVTVDGSDNVTKWEDISGENLYVQSPATTNRPENVENVIKFSGGGVNAEFMNLFDVSEAATSITLDVSVNGYCVIIVYAAEDWGVTKVVLGNSSNSETYITHHSTSPDKFDFIAGNTLKTFSSSTALTNDKHYAVMFNTSTQGVTTLYVNNAAQEGTKTNTSDPVFSQIGTTNSDNSTSLQGKIKEIIIYEKQLVASERDQLYNYLSPLVS
tara:strand:+ start:346 stop:1077 length:732 start_codon:yes stop_codon:yes gene_type:complete